MASTSASKDIITLVGSKPIVIELFEYAANSIFYNHGFYPEKSFGKVKKYGLPLLLSQDERANLKPQLFERLEVGKLQRLVLIIKSKCTNQLLERWNFGIKNVGEVVEIGVSTEKSDKAIMRQIALNITSSPCLDEPCVFDVVANTGTDVAVPFIWTDCDPKLIDNPKMVKSHSVYPEKHRVDTLLSKPSTKISLQGSTTLVSEFFGYAEQSILNDRGVYPKESFGKVKKSGLPWLASQNESVKTFFANLNAQLSFW